MMILTIDTSSQTLLVGLFEADEQIDHIEKVSKNDHASILMPAIQELLRKNKVHIKQIKQILVNNGPGSYTGTRIGVTTAKTIGWAAKIPVQAVSSLDVYMEAGGQELAYMSPVIDARRQAVYTSLAKSEKGKLIKLEEEQYITIDQWKGLLSPIKKEVTILIPMTDDLQAFFPKDEGWQVQTVELSPQALYKAAQNLPKKETHVHQIVPNYLRITEAEQNLLKQQNGVKKDD